MMSTAMHAFSVCVGGRGEGTQGAINWELPWLYKPYAIVLLVYILTPPQMRDQNFESQGLIIPTSFCLIRFQLVL